MTEQFTYPSLKCVLEYLEANKKFHITARSPQLQKFEKSVPLRLNNLTFSDWKISINDLSFSFTIEETLIEPVSAGALFFPKSLESSEELLPGDLVLKFNNGTKYSSQVYINFERNSNTRTKRLPDGMRIHEAMKTFAEKLLGGRKEISVETLEVLTLSQQILRIPENLKFTPVNLDIGRHSLEDVLPILELSKRFSNLRITIWKPSYVGNHIIQNVKLLTIFYSSWIHSTRFWLNLLPIIPTENIYFTNEFLPEEDIQRIVNIWIEYGQVIGKSYAFDCSGRNSMDKCVKKVQKKFNGSHVTMKKEVVEKNVIATSIVAIPMKDTSSKLVFHGVQLTQNKKVFYYVRMIVLEENMVTPVEQIEGNRLWESSMFQCLIVFCASIFAIWVLLFM